MGDPSRRLSEADAMFLAIEKAAGAAYAPLCVSVYERSFEQDETLDHLREVLARLLPNTRRRIVRDRFSTALPRWVDVPGFDPADHEIVLPPPGDGSLRAILDWAARWGRLPMSLDTPPWRTVFFENVTVDGVPGRLVSVGQTHHALIDGQGFKRMAEQYLQWAPDGPLPVMPPPVPAESITGWERWKEGWGLEAAKAKELLTHTAARARWAARDPTAGFARARQLGAAFGRMRHQQGSTPCSPLLVRRSDRMRFDELPVDLRSLKAGARVEGGSVNDGFMAALSLGLTQYHLDHGVKVPTLRTLMAINTRPDDGGHTGNEVLAVMLPLPLGDDDPTRVLKHCAALSREQRQDRDVLWLLDRFRAMTNRWPSPLIVAATRAAMRGVDLQVSNVNGIPVRNWVAGVENLRFLPFPVASSAGLAMTLISTAGAADLAITTCPEAIPDPAHLLARINDGLIAISALAQ